MEDKYPSIDRRTVLQGVTAATIGTNATVTTAAANDSGTQYVGVSYCPVTDKQQAPATAVLNHTPNGLTGRLSIADFDIKLGAESRLEDTTSHPDATRHTFTSADKNHAIIRDDKKLGLIGRIDSDGKTYTGTITRPHPAYGKLAFSLAPTTQGFSSDTVASALNPEAYRPVTPGFDDIAIPDTGIPTDNSLQHLSNLEAADSNLTTNTSNSESSTIVNIATSTSSSNPDVGVLESNINDPSISEPLEDYCDDKYGGEGTMSWKLAPNVTAERRYDAYGNIESDYDEIIQSSAKIWRIQVFFEEIPDPVVELCDQQDYSPYQANVELNVRQGLDTSVKQARLQNPSPDADTDDSSSPSDSTIGTVLDLVSAAGGPYTSIATTLIDYSLIDNPSSDIFNYDDSYNDSLYPDVDKEEFSWDLTLDGYNEDSPGSNVFADTTDNTVGVEFEISNKAGDGKNPVFEASGFYTWTYRSYVDGYCPCQSNNTTLKTNSGYFGTLYPDYTSINDPDS